MHPKLFIDRLDDEKVVAAIAEAELSTSGEVRVCIAHRRNADTMAAAQKCFLKMGMNRTRHRNAVLVYFAPHEQLFAICGDVGIHDQCGDQFWQDVTAQITPLLKAHQLTEAVVLAVRRIGEALSTYFPRGPDDNHQLPNPIVRD
ncbi:MAG: TPM domain-containing protein [Lacunisphaera sp.]